LYGRSALHGTGAKFGLRDYADSQIVAALREHCVEDIAIFLDRIDTGVRVQQKHYSFLRLTGFPCGGRSKSSDMPRNDSTHPSGHPRFGSRITAFPSRRTSTLSPSKRNSFGRRTAWLRPVQNRLAFFGFVVFSLMVPTRDSYHFITTRTTYPRTPRYRTGSGHPPPPPPR